MNMLTSEQKMWFSLIIANAWLASNHWSGYIWLVAAAIYGHDWLKTQLDGPTHGCDPQ